MPDSDRRQKTERWTCNLPNLFQDSGLQRKHREKTFPVRKKRPEIQTRARHQPSHSVLSDRSGDSPQKIPQPVRCRDGTGALRIPCRAGKGGNAQSAGAQGFRKRGKNFGIVQYLCTERASEGAHGICHGA